MRRLNINNVMHRCGLLWLGMFLCAGAWSADRTPQDSIVVDGQHLRVIADVRIDTSAWQVSTSESDWWFGVGWDIQASPLSASGTHISTLDLFSNRPALRVERQQVMRKGGGRLGLFAEHSQPWTFSSEDVSENAKGWIWGGEGQGSSSIQQFTLTPDSLAFERDTTMAPLSPGHAVRVGVSWEGQPMGGWRPRAAVSGFAWRPFGWSLRAPGDPASWMATNASDTFQREAMWRARMRLELGLVLDLGESYPSARSAAQFRVDAFWLPGSIGGLFFSLVMSPTRR